MLTLAIETSGRAGSIALKQSGQLLASVDLTANGRRHARTLVPEIGDLLQQHQLTPRQIELLAVSIGPGSFTGLRVGIVCAKTLTYATGCQLVAVDTFSAVAAAQQQTTRIWVIEDALRGDLCAGEYELRGGIWNAIAPPQLVEFELWRSQLAPNSLITGPGLGQYAESLSDFHLIDATLREPHAAHVADQGELLAAARRSDDCWTLEPFYMRRSAAEEKADAARATT